MYKGKKTTALLAWFGCLWLLFLGEGPASGQTYVWTTIAGQAGATGSADGTNTEARFYNPSGIAVGPAGELYVADTRNCTLRKLAPLGSDWVVTTIAGQALQAGSVDSSNADARFNRPNGIAIDSSGSLFVVDHYNHTIRKAAPVLGDWVVTTIAGMPGTSGSDDGMNAEARFYSPTGIAIDNGGTLYVTDTLNNTVRAVTPAGGDWLVSTLAGLSDIYGDYVDGYGFDARFWSPTFMTIDTSTNLYVADWGNNVIRQMSPEGSDWTVTTIAGWTNSGSMDGTGAEARFNFPNGIAVDAAGTLYVADQDNHTIRKLAHDGTNWVVTTIGGVALQPGSVDGVGAEARFRRPWGIAVDGAGVLYVADFSNQAIRKGVPKAAAGPALAIERRGSEVILSWNASGSNYVVETTPIPAPGAAWTPVTTPPTLTGAGFVLTNAIGDLPAFYRLRREP